MIAKNWQRQHEIYRGPCVAYHRRRVVQLPEIYYITFLTRNQLRGDQTKSYLQNLGSCKFIPNKKIRIIEDKYWTLSICCTSHNMVVHLPFTDRTTFKNF